VKTRQGGAKSECHSQLDDLSVAEAWQRQWEVVVEISTITADGTPVIDSVDWAADRREASDRVWGVGRAWAAQFEGLSFVAAGQRWAVDCSSSCFRPGLEDETACFLQLVVRDAGTPESLEEEALGEALTAAVLAAIDTDRQVEFEGQTFHGHVSPVAHAFCDVDAMMSSAAVGYLGVPGAATMAIVAMAIVLLASLLT
jgi:hypothetical protein